MLLFPHFIHLYSPPRYLHRSVLCFLPIQLQSAIVKVQSSDLLIVLCTSNYVSIVPKMGITSLLSVPRPRPIRDPLLFLWLTASPTFSKFCATFNQLWMTLVSFHMISRRLAFCFFPHSTLCFGTVCAFQYFPLRSTCNSCCPPNSCRKAFFFASTLRQLLALHVSPSIRGVSLFQLHDVVFCPLLQVSDFYMPR